jgi:hypothetical protein
MNFSELVPYQNAAFSHQGEKVAISKERDLFVIKNSLSFIGL